MFLSCLLLLLFVIPSAYEVCRGVYSFHLSICLSICPCIHPSIQVLTFCVKVSHEVFSLNLIFLKAYPLGCICMISVTSI